MKAFALEDGTYSAKTFQEARLKTGYMVSVSGGMQIDAMANQAAAEWVIRKVAEDARTRGAYLGLWTDGGIIYVDISLNVKSLKVALALAEKENQLAIWDLQKNKCIYLKKYLKKGVDKV